MGGALSDEVFAHELAELRVHWDDPRYHRRLVARFGAEQNLAVVGALYRRVRDEDPDRSEQAQQAIDSLFKEALTHLAAERSVTPKPPSGLRFLVLGVVSFAAVYLTLSIIHRFL
jgi:hypothetical protein